MLSLTAQALTEREGLPTVRINTYNMSGRITCIIVESGLQLEYTSMKEEQEKALIICSTCYRLILENPFVTACYHYFLVGFKTSRLLKLCIQLLPK